MSVAGVVAILAEQAPVQTFGCCTGARPAVAADYDAHKRDPGPACDASLKALRDSRAENRRLVALGLPRLGIYDVAPTAPNTSIRTPRHSRDGALTNAELVVWNPEVELL